MELADGIKIIPGGVKKVENGGAGNSGKYQCGHGEEAKRRAHGEFRRDGLRLRFHGLVVSVMMRKVEFGMPGEGE